MEIFYSTITSFFVSFSVTFLILRFMNFRKEIEKSRRLRTFPEFESRLFLSKFENLSWEDHQKLQTLKWAQEVYECLRTVKPKEAEEFKNAVGMEAKLATLRRIQHEL